MTANVNAPAPPPGEVERLTTLLEQWHWEQLGPSATRFPWSGRPLAEWLLSHGLTVARDAGHDIELVGPGELQWCRRCHGGEVELQESCAIRLAREVEILRTRIKRGQEREQDYSARLEKLTVARDAPSEVARDLATALAALMDAVGNMPADPSECWPGEWNAAIDALEAYKASRQPEKGGA